jgi:hypothetical protein
MAGHSLSEKTYRGQPVAVGLNEQIFGLNQQIR